VRIVSIGEILWDVFPEGEHRNTEHLGGAPFNFAVNAHRLGHQVTFVSAVGDDDRGRRALAQIAELGLDPQFVTIVPDARTGLVTVAFDSQDEPSYTIHRPAAYDFVQAPTSCVADWAYFGTLLQMNARARTAVKALLDSTPAKRFYDVNLRPDSYTLELVEELLADADVVKMNEAEAQMTRPLMKKMMNAKSFDAVCITRGERGCSVQIRDEYVESPGYPVSGGDPVGAGDAFAAAFLHGLDAGWPALAIADFANRAGAQAAQRPGAI
jgi:fructokinase